jgi:hypothetical protein
MRFSTLAKRTRIVSDAKNARGCRDPSRAARGFARGARTLRGARSRGSRGAEPQTREKRVKRSLRFTRGQTGAVARLGHQWHAVFTTSNASVHQASQPLRGARPPYRTRLTIGLLVSRSTPHRFRATAPIRKPPPSRAITNSPACRRRSFPAVPSLNSDESGASDPFSPATQGRGDNDDNPLTRPRDS